MYISRVYIKNYRNFKDFDLRLKDGEPLTLIGSNNSGKTNFLKALRLVLDANLPPWERHLTKEDFSWQAGASLWEKGDEIVITVTFNNVDENEEVKAFLYSISPKEQEDPSNILEANISYIFAPSVVNKSGGYDFDEDYTNFLVAGRYHPSGYYFDADGSKKVYSDDVMKELHGCNDIKDFYKYFYLSTENIEEIRSGKTNDLDKIIKNQTYANKIRKHINLLYLDALRDVKDDFYKGYNSLVSQLIRANIKKGKSNKVGNEITKAFKDLRSGTSMPETNSILSNIEGRLQNDTVNLLTDKAGLIVSTPKINLENIGRYFNFLIDLHEDLQSALDMETIGLGYQNLAYISAIFALFELKKEIVLSDSQEKIKLVYNLLLIEEPESHLDVQNQKFLHTQIENKTKKLDEISKEDSDDENTFMPFTQVIQSSHSTHLASKSDLKNIVVLQRDSKNAYAINIDAALKVDESNYKHNKRILKQYLDATRSALLFAKKVILVEGLSEKYVMGTLVNAYIKSNKPNSVNDIDSEGIEIVEVGGKIFDPYTQIYKLPFGLKNKCLCIKDGDVHGNDPISNYKEQYNELNTTTTQDSFIKSQHNVFTFEIDTFFLPNPEDKSIDNIEYLKLILYRFQKDGDYYKKDETLRSKLGEIDELSNKVKGEKGLTKEDIDGFLNSILENEVSKPNLSLYLSSILKAKLLNDPVEIDNWMDEENEDTNTQVVNDYPSYNSLPEFVIPKYLEDGLKWLITDQN